MKNYNLWRLRNNKRIFKNRVSKIWISLIKLMKMKRFWDILINQLHQEELYVHRYNKMMIKNRNRFQIVHKMNKTLNKIQDLRILIK